MDNSWLFDNEVDCEEPESDDEETQKELESRLYAIVHHNDLSQPLPPELARHYSVDRADNGELEVTLKLSLDDLKNEEMEDKPFKNEDSDEIKSIPNDDSAVTAIFPDGIEVEKRPSLKRPRYSDVNLDTCPTENNKDVRSPQNINFFNHGPRFFRGKMCKFSKLVIPSSLDYSDWKNEANSSFISIEECKNAATILEKMTQALARCNPGTKLAKLAEVASALYNRNLKIFRNKTNKKLKSKKPSIDQNLSLTDSSKRTINLTQELDLLRNKLNDEIEECKANINKKRRKDMNGSISLNISPFRPDPQVIDLVSDEDNVRVEENTIPTSTPKLKLHRPRKKLQLPLKWSRDMAMFYTKPSKRKMKMDAVAMIQHLKRTTKAKDWKVDPQDEKGFYQSSSSSNQKQKRRCVNCNERGHRALDCPRPRKCCILCGDPRHMSYSCPNKICLKCGLFLPMSYDGDECRDCYYITMGDVTACEFCGSFCHRSVNCTDLWRSFHATTEGEKNIPVNIKKNSRRFCCNCGKGEHFAEECQFPQYSGQQASSFVTNYCCNIEELGTADISFPHDYSEVLSCPKADMFLRDLSNSSKAGILCVENQEGLVFQIKGTFEQCKKVKTELEKFVNVNKRKWQGPGQRRKKRKVF